MTKSPFSVNRFRNTFSICWLAIVIDTTYLLHWYGWNWKVSITDSCVSTFILLLVTLLMMNTLRYYTPGKQRYINIVIWCIFLAGLWLVVSRWILILSFGNVDGYTVFLNHSLIIRACIGFLLLGCITLVSVLWFNWGEQKEQEKRHIDMEKLAKESELFKLRQQLQPHFLFNSLNSINALIGSRPEEARKMVQQLSDFLRGTLKKEETQWITLQEEIQYLQLYLDIERVRFGNRLATEIISNDETNKLKLPVLLLQPIVENAIKFGLYDTTGETLISIRAVKEGNELVITAQNPFDPETSSPNQGLGFGLKSIQRRLYLLFARTDLLTTDSRGSIFITTVRIPQPAEPAAKTINPFPNQKNSLS